MHLLITIIAAIVATSIWYFNDHRKELRLGTLCLIYQGAALMWSVDAVASYLEALHQPDGLAEFFSVSAADALNESVLGIYAVAIGLIIWLVQLIISDPKSVLEHTK